MMTKEVRNWLAGSIAAVLVLAVWVFLVQPKSADVEKGVRPLPNLPDKNLLNDNFNQELQHRDTNGTLPVSPAPANPPRSDPFS